MALFPTSQIVCRALSRVEDKVGVDYVVILWKDETISVKEASQVTLREIHDLAAYFTYIRGGRNEVGPRASKDRKHIGLLTRDLQIEWIYAFGASTLRRLYKMPSARRPESDLLR